MTVTDAPSIQAPSPVPSATATADAAAEARRDALVERSFEALVGAMELFSVELGHRLGCYRALADHGPSTPAQLAARVGIHERYAVEWCEQQAVAGILDVVAEATDRRDGGRVYAVPAGVAEAVLDPESPASITSIAPSIVGIAAVVDALETAYRTGGGVSFADFGSGIRHGIGGMNRPAFSEVADWLGAVPGLGARLAAGGRVLDLGCGTGWSSIEIARAFPSVHVHGVDLDEASVADARANAVAAGVADRVTFGVGDAADPSSLGEGWDVVGIFEMLHDSAHPVAILEQVRGVLADDGEAIVVDERVADEFTAPGDFVERMMYAWSVVHCLPATMAEEPSIASGTVLRTPTVRSYAVAAGWSGIEVLDAGNEVWKVYRLVR